MRPGSLGRPERAVRASATDPASLLPRTGRACLAAMRDGTRLVGCAVVLDFRELIQSYWKWINSPKIA